MTDEARYEQLHSMLVQLTETLGDLRKEFASSVADIRKESKEDRRLMSGELQLMLTQLVEARTRLFVAEKDIVDTRKSVATAVDSVGTHRITFEERMAKMEADYTERINLIRVDAAVRATQISIAGAIVTWLLAMLPGWLKGH